MKKTTIINKTNCEGHAALLVREKRARPEGDLGPFSHCSLDLPSR